MTLVDREILQRHNRQALLDPFDASQLQPASIDVCLGNDFLVFERNHETCIDMADPVDISKKVTIPDDGYFLLHPGEFVLGHTFEKVMIPDDIVARIDGKSSVGRLGLFVHITAGYIDPGFEGRITLEMACLHPLPIKIRPRLPIAQLVFEQLASKPAQPYTGRYQGDATVVASRYGNKD